MYVFLQLLTDGSPNEHLRKKEKKGDEEKRMQADTLKRNNTSIIFASGLWKDMGFPN